MAKYGVSITNVQPGKHTAYVQQPVIDKSERATTLNTIAQGINVAGTIAGTYADHKAKKEAEGVATDIESDIEAYQQSNPSGAIQNIQTLSSMRDPASGALYTDPNNWASSKADTDAVTKNINEQMKVLSNARSQGAMSELELYERVNSHIRSAAAKNPYYTAEFIKAGSDTLALHNVAKRVAFNNKYYKDINAATDAENKAWFKFLLTNKQTVPTNGDGTINYEAAKKKANSYLRQTQALSDLELVEQKTDAEITVDIQNGNLAKQLGHATTAVYEGILTELSEDPELTKANANLKIDDIFFRKINMITSSPAFGRLMGHAEAKPMIESYIKKLENMQVTLKSHASGKDFNEYITRELQNSRNLVEYSMIEKGLGPATQNLIKTLSTLQRDNVEIMNMLDQDPDGQIQTYFEYLSTLIGGEQAISLKKIQEFLANPDRGIGGGDPGSFTDPIAKEKLQKFKLELKRSDDFYFKTDATNNTTVDNVLDGIRTFFSKGETENSPDLTANTPEIGGMKEAQNNTYDFIMQQIESITDTTPEAQNKRLFRNSILLRNLAQENPDHLHLKPDVVTRFNNQIPQYIGHLKTQLEKFGMDKSAIDAEIEMLPSGELQLRGIPGNQGIGKVLTNIINQMNNSWKAYSNVNKIPRTKADAGQFFGDYFKTQLETIDAVGDPDMDSEIIKEPDFIEDLLPDASRNIMEVNQYSTADTGKGPTQDWEYVANKIKSDPKFLTSADGISKILNVGRQDYLNLIQAISNVESYGGDYGAVGTNADGDEMWGKYQFAPATREELAKKLKMTMPSKEEFLNNGLIQERFYTVYAEQVNRYLIKNSPKYKTMSPIQRLPYIAAAQFGMGNVRKYLELGAKITDSKGTDIRIFIKEYNDYINSLKRLPEYFGP